MTTGDKVIVTSSGDVETRIFLFEKGDQVFVTTEESWFSGDFLIAAYSHFSQYVSETY